MFMLLINKITEPLLRSMFLIGILITSCICVYMVFMVTHYKDQMASKELAGFELRL
jgi:cyanate permease